MMETSYPRIVRYGVRTWDAELQKWTPQEGVPEGPYSKWGLRVAIRKLRAMGYPANYSSARDGGDHFVLFERL